VIVGGLSASSASAAAPPPPRKQLLCRTSVTTEFHNRGLNSLIHFVPRKDDNYRIIVTTFQGTGAYLLTVRKGPQPKSKDKKVRLAVLVERRANIAAALLAMGREQKTWPLLKHQPDPSLRSYLIEALGSAGPDAPILIARLEREPDVSVRRAILLSLGGYGLERLSLAERENWLPMLLQLFRDDSDPGIHGAAEYLVRRWGQEEKLKAVDKELMTGKVEGKRAWYINRQGQTMVVIGKPGEFLTGAGRERHKETSLHVDRRRIPKNVWHRPAPGGAGVFEQDALPLAMPAAADRDPLIREPFF
jgi:hypothetical protein